MDLAMPVALYFLCFGRLVRSHGKGTSSLPCMAHADHVVNIAKGEFK
jgi:hypothetical protein